MKHRQFIDKKKNENLKDGIEFYAVGLIKDFVEVTEPSHSGKDYPVRFIDPWGWPNSEWRGANDIIISDISDEDADKLLEAFNRVEYP